VKRPTARRFQLVNSQFSILYTAVHHRQRQRDAQQGRSAGKRRDLTILNSTLQFIIVNFKETPNKGEVQEKDEI
jgi:hypothetical protein